MVFPENPYVDSDRFAKFLVSAKKATYASGVKPLWLANGAHVFQFQEDNLVYSDVYLGNTHFAGAESVASLTSDGTVFWILHYHGGIITPPDEFAIFTITVADLFTFLQKALMNVSEKHPFRGPSFFKEGLWRYNHWWMKNSTGFNGYEAIWYGPDELCKTKVYELHFHCGLIA